MTWGLHDSIEIEKRGRPAVTVITEAFTVAAAARAGVLGMPDHPVAVAEHPFINRTAGTRETGLGVLQTVAGAMRVLGAPIYYQIANRLPVVVVLGPEHAIEIARAGFSRRDVRTYLYEHARMPDVELMGRCYFNSNTWPAWIDATRPDTLVPIVSDPDDIVLVVAGGDGRHSAWMPAWNVSRGATELIEES